MNKNVEAKIGWAVAVFAVLLFVGGAVKGCSDDNKKNAEIAKLADSTRQLNASLDSLEANYAELWDEYENQKDKSVALDDSLSLYRDSVARVSQRLSDCEAGKRCPTKRKPTKQPAKKPTAVKPAPAKPDTIVVSHVGDKDSTKIVCPTGAGNVSVHGDGNTTVVNNGVIINNNNGDKDAKDAVEVTRVVKRRIVVTYSRCR